VRHEFRDQWHQWISGANTTLGPLDISRRFPLLFAGKKITVLKDRDYCLIDHLGMTPLTAVTTGGVNVALQSPDSELRVVITDLSQQARMTIDRTKPDELPTDLLIVFRFKAED
jgi:hypothetical protein